MSGSLHRQFSGLIDGGVQEWAFLRSYPFGLSMLDAMSFEEVLHFSGHEVGILSQTGSHLKTCFVNFGYGLFFGVKLVFRRKY